MRHSKPPAGLVPEVIEIETQRLRLRQWRQEDRAPFASLNGDPRVMEFFPSTLTAAQSDAMADRCEALIAERGWGFWAVEATATNRFIGFVGLHIPSAELPCSPCVEVGWRLAREFWGRGLATEAAAAAVSTGFHRLGLPEIVAFTPLQNVRSRAVMKRLGMLESGAFDHPHVPENSGVRRHCLCRLPAAVRDA